MENLAKKRVIVADMDEVIVNIVPLWVYTAIVNKPMLEEYFDLDINYSPEMVLQRETYLIQEWLKRKDVGEVPKSIMAIFNSLYCKDKNFYAKCPPTPMAMGLRESLNHDVLEKLYIVTHCFEGTEEWKRDWLINFFGTDDRIVFVPVPLSEKKSDAFKELEIEYDVFIDDSLKNIKDVMENTNSFDKEFMIPKLGYNKRTEELTNLAKDYFAQVIYYSNVT